MLDEHELLRNSVIIGAHPDDELLWFTSILKKVDEVIILYRDIWSEPQMGDARVAAIKAYPRGNVAFSKWKRPAPSTAPTGQARSQVPTEWNSEPRVRAARPSVSSRNRCRS